MTRITLEIPDDPRAQALLDQLRVLGAHTQDPQTHAPQTQAPQAAPLHTSPDHRSALHTLVTGGARSGKSSMAESMLADETQVDYVATSQRRADDAEWMARIAAHVARRPSGWNTIETIDLVPVLAADGPPALVDCLGVWLTRVLDVTDAWNEPDAAAPQIDQRIDAVAAAIAGSPRRLVLVTNEVGSGVVPATASGRAFRDWLGILNTRVADACDEVLYCIAGRALSLPRYSAPTIPGGSNIR